MCVCMRVCVYVRTSLETGSLASLLNFFSYKSLRLPTWEWKYTHPCCQDAYCHRFFFSFCCLFFCCFVLLLLQVVMVFYCFLSFFEGGQFKTGLLWVPLAAPNLQRSPHLCLLRAGVTGMSLHAWLVCLVLFVLKTGIHYVALAGLELRDPPARCLECWD